jgi:ribosomal protein S18 acetylase RimI-like enzyme
MKLYPFDRQYLPQAAELFVQNLAAQRAAAPGLSDRLEHPDRAATELARIFQRCLGVIAVEDDGRLAGYLGWFVVDGFRGTQRRAAYVPEWGHATLAERRPDIYRALYRAAGEQWSAAGCNVHAITLLAHDRAAQQVWFWNGFGLLVVDAVRPMQPLDVPAQTDLAVRTATLDDVARLAALDEEHCQHYARAPIFMAPRTGDSADQFAGFLSQPKNSVWLALDGAEPVGFLRFEGYDFDCAAIVQSDQTIRISGAFVRPAYRGRSAAAALLDAALRHYAGRGFTCCAVDFESFNPEAAVFWMRYFEPVAFSLTRVPETCP